METDDRLRDKINPPILVPGCHDAAAPCAARGEDTADDDRSYLSNSSRFAFFPPVAAALHPGLAAAFTVVLEGNTQYPVCPSLDRRRLPHTASPLTPPKQYTVVAKSPIRAQPQEVENAVEIDVARPGGCHGPAGGGAGQRAHAQVPVGAYFDAIGYAMNEVSNRFAIIYDAGE
jgi:hypothetical protein